MITYLAYAKAKKEFEVEQDLRDLGLAVWVARKIEFVRRGKRQVFEAKEAPYLPNYIFIECPDSAFKDVRAHKHIIGKPEPLSGLDMRSLGIFREHVEVEYQDAQRVEGNQVAMKAFKAGQAMRFVDQRFEDNLLRFKEMVETAEHSYPRVRMEMEMMGQVVEIDADPIDVRGVE